MEKCTILQILIVFTAWNLVNPWTSISHCVWRDGGYVCHKIQRALADKIYFPMNACVITECTDCVTSIKTMLLTPERQLVEPSYFETSQKFQQNGKTQVYDCVVGKEHCSCATDRLCNGTKTYCENMGCDQTSQCFCKVEKAVSTLIHKVKKQILTNPEKVTFPICQFKMTHANTSHILQHRLRRHLLSDATFEDNGLTVKFNDPVLTIDQPGTLIIRIHGLEKIFFLNATNLQAIVPSDFLRFKGTMEFILVNLQGKSVRGNFQIEGAITCRSVDCLFCMEAIKQLECLPKYVAYAIIVVLIILTAICILYIRTILYILYTLGYTVYFAVKQALRILKGMSRLSLITGDTMGNKLRNLAVQANAILDRHARVNPTVTALVFLALFSAVSAECNNHMVMKTKNSDCTEVANELNCKLETHVQVTLENFGFQQCLWLQDEKRNTLVQLKLRLESGSCVWHTIKEYYTYHVDWRLIHQAFCPQKVMCGWGVHCLKVRSEFSAMTEESKSWPGLTGCYAGDSGSSSCTIVDSQSCHFYRLFLIPDYLRTYEVRRIINHECSFEISVQEIGNLTKEYIKIKRVANTEKGVRIQVIGAYDQAATVSNFHLISRVGNVQESYIDVVSPVGRPQEGQIGDVQGNSSLSKDFLFDKNMFTCNFYEDDATCTRTESYLSTLVETKTSALPRTVGYHMLNLDEEGRLKSTLLVTQPVVVALTFQDYEVHIKTNTVCPKFSEDEVLVKGCYACSTLAQVTIQAMSTCEKGTVSVEFEYIRVATRAIQLDTEMKPIIIEFHSENQCVRDKLCLQAKTLRTCKVIRFCLEEGNINLRHPNISHITSFASAFNTADGWNFSFLSGFAGLGHYLKNGVLVAIFILLVFFVSAVCITCCRGR